MRAAPVFVIADSLAVTAYRFKLTGFAIASADPSPSSTTPSPALLASPTLRSFETFAHPSSKSLLSDLAASSTLALFISTPTLSALANPFITIGLSINPATS